MKTSLEEISPVKKKLTIEVDSKEVDGKLMAAYKKVGRQAKVPGFRPGKVPKSILERYFGEQVHNDVTRTIVGETFPKALEEADLYPLGTPVLEKNAIKAGQSFTYTAIMEVRPQFDLKDYLGVEIEKEKCVISDEDVEKRLDQIQKAHGKLAGVEEDRPVKEGDYVVLEYEGFEGQSPIDGIKSSNFLVKVGSGDFHPLFESALVGLRKDERTEVEVDFEEDYYHQKLAGKKVRFNVRIHDLKEMVLPELNDEFVKNFGADIKDMDAFRQKVQETLLKEEEKRIDTDLKTRLLGKIGEAVEFELPEILVTAEIENALSRVRENLRRSGSTMEKAGISEEKLKEDFRKDSENRVKEMLILEEIAKREQLEVEDEELSKGIADIADSMGQPAENIRRYYEARDLMDSLKATLMEEKTLNYLVEHANIQIVEKAVSEPKEESEPEKEAD